MRYKYISQKPYCCVVACVQMLLQRRQLPLLTQEEIAYELGVVLPPDQRHLLPKSYKVAKPKSGYGTRIQTKRYALKGFFRRRKYPLTDAYFIGNRFRTAMTLRKFLREQLGAGNDLLTCFNYPLLYGLNGSWGHASLVERIDDEFVYLRDPDPSQKKLRRVVIADLRKAMQGFAGRGVWVIEDKYKYE